MQPTSLRHQRRHPHHREIAVQPYSPADTALAERARRPARRAVLLELRVSRPLHALGHGVCRSAAGVDRARPRLHGRGAERARPHCCCRPIAEASGGARRRASSGIAAPTGSTGEIGESDDALSRRRSAAGSPRLLGAARARTICSPAARTSISASTARSATIWSSSSSRCSSSCRAPTTSATSCSTCRTRSWSSITCGSKRRSTATNSRSAAVRPPACRARPRRRPTRRRRPCRCRPKRSRARRIRRRWSAGQGSLRARRPVRGRARPAVLEPLRRPAEPSSSSGCARPTRRPTAR